MKAIQPYLFFNGNCREAMEFYANVLGGKLSMMTYTEGPPMPGHSTADANRIMHANILAPDGSALMASDAPPGDSVPEGKNFSLSIACDNAAEQDKMFVALSEGGQVRQPLQDTFWGARFGMLHDRFGVTWMLSYHNPTGHQQGA